MPVGHVLGGRHLGSVTVVMLNGGHLLVPSLTRMLVRYAFNRRFCFTVLSTTTLQVRYYAHKSEN